MLAIDYAIGDIFILDINNLISGENKYSKILFDLKLNEGKDLDIGKAKECIYRVSMATDVELGISKESFNDLIKFLTYFKTHIKCPTITNVDIYKPDETSMTTTEPTHLSLSQLTEVLNLLSDDNNILVISPPMTRVVDHETEVIDIRFYMKRDILGINKLLSYDKFNDNIYLLNKKTQADTMNLLQLQDHIKIINVDKKEEVTYTIGNLHGISKNRNFKTEGVKERAVKVFNTIIEAYKDITNQIIFGIARMTGSPYIINKVSDTLIVIPLLMLNSNHQYNNKIQISGNTLTTILAVEAKNDDTRLLAIY